MWEFVTILTVRGTSSRRCESSSEWEWIDASNGTSETRWADDVIVYSTLQYTSVPAWCSCECSHLYLDSSHRLPLSGEDGKVMIAFDLSFVVHVSQHLQLRMFTMHIFGKSITCLSQERWSLLWECIILMIITILSWKGLLKITYFNITSRNVMIGNESDM